MNLEVIFSYIPLYVEAFFLTVRIGWIGIFLALVIGVFVAFVIYFKVPVLADICLSWACCPAHVRRSR